MEQNQDDSQASADAAGIRESLVTEERMEERQC